MINLLLMGMVWLSYSPKFWFVEAKENQNKVPTLNWLSNSIKPLIKQDLLWILVLVQQQTILNC